MFYIIDNQLSLRNIMAGKSTYTQEIGDAICDRIADGESLRTICDDDEMPSRWSVFRWIDGNELFRNQYTHARELQAYGLLDEIIGISDDDSQDELLTESGVRANSEFIQRSKIRIDARKWYLSKMLPKVCGDKLDLDVTGNMEITQVTRKIID